MTRAKATGRGTRGKEKVKDGQLPAGIAAMVTGGKPRRSMAYACCLRQFSLRCHNLLMNMDSIDLLLSVFPLGLTRRRDTPGIAYFLMNPRLCMKGEKGPPQ